MTESKSITLEPGLWTVDSAQKFEDMRKLVMSIAEYCNDCRDSEHDTDILDVALSTACCVMLGPILCMDNPEAQFELAITLKNTSTILQNIEPIKATLQFDDTPNTKNDPAPKWAKDLFDGFEKQ